MHYVHVDVFSMKPLGGNGLTVAFPGGDVGSDILQEMAREFKQFETAFVYPERLGAFPVRVFTIEEELPFAGHPLLGSAAVIHREFFRERTRTAISIALKGRTVSLESVVRDTDGGKGARYTVTMNQGRPDFIATVDPTRARAIGSALSLDIADLDPAYPLEVVSTGLPYLLVPLRSGLDRARVAGPGFESFLVGLGAKYAYLFDTATLECRTWDNSGLAEDAATGSAAGPLAASLVRQGRFREGETITLSQGRFVGRPSLIECRLEQGEVFIAGDVAVFAEGKTL